MRAATLVSAILGRGYGVWLAGFDHVERNVRLPNPDGLAIEPIPMQPMGSISLYIRFVP